MEPRRTVPLVATRSLIGPSRRPTPDAYRSPAITWLSTTWVSARTSRDFSLARLSTASSLHRSVRHQATARSHRKPLAATHAEPAGSHPYGHHQLGAAPPAFGEAPVRDWQAAGLLKSSLIKPVITSLEQHLLRKILGRLSDHDQRALREIIMAVVG